MPSTFLNVAGRQTIQAGNNPTQNATQVQNQQPVTPNANTTQGLQPVQQQPQTNQGINPITIPIQIQPQVAAVGQQQGSGQNNIATISNEQQAPTNQNSNNAPVPQQYQGTQNNNVVDFNDIYSSYQSNYGTNQNNGNPSGVKKTTYNTTIVTPTTSNLNSVEGQYQSAYADTVNSLIAEMIERLNSGFEYDPTQDAALQVATEYAANSTLQSLAGSGVLNSTATAERVARIVSELIPQYEEKAHDRYMEYLNQLATTAQLVMDYDTQQFNYWKDAKDREFENKKFEYEKQQQALENAWKRVDELGYVDNEASQVLGVAVGTLSGEARMAKEQQEFELKKMREQLEIQRANEEALARLKSELDYENNRRLAEFENNLNIQRSKALAEYESALQTQRSKELAAYENQLAKDKAAYESALQTQRSKELTEYEYQMRNKYGTSTVSTTNSSSTAINTSKNNNASVYRKGNLLVVEKNGQLYQLNITSGASKQTILNWGNSIGVDLSGYF